VKTTNDSAIQTLGGVEFDAGFAIHATFLSLTDPLCIPASTDKDPGSSVCGDSGEIGQHIPLSGQIEAIYVIAQP
jgi:hypothetical protein